MSTEQNPRHSEIQSFLTLSKPTLESGTAGHDSIPMKPNDPAGIENGSIGFYWAGLFLADCLASGDPKLVNFEFGSFVFC